MKLIVCLDDQNGMLFNRRRQSADQALCQRILFVTKGEKLWMNGYSAKLFPEAHILIDEDFLKKCTSSDWCFVENIDLTPYLDKIDLVRIYRWNRRYPTDRVFPMDMKGWTKVSSYDFEGNSHEKITEEVYAL